MVQHNASLLPFNTFGIDVRARELTVAHTRDHLNEVLEHLRQRPQQLLVLGGGSNVLFTRDFNGLVVLNHLEGIGTVGETEDHVDVRAGAGVVWHELVRHCVTNGWGGLENLSLIPGKAGAAPMQNIGAYGVELKDVFVELEALHIASRETRTFTHADCRFGYRDSVFKGPEKGQYIICSITVRLSKRPRLNVSYGAIGQELERMGAMEPSVADVSQAVMNIRRSKLPDPEVLGNAGSFFKNPVVSAEHAERLRSTFDSMPTYPATNGVKLAAGWLIEQCGWKGRVIGRAGCHQHQALVLVNHGGATGEEIYHLSEQILQSVSDRFGVELEREVNVL